MEDQLMNQRAIEGDEVELTLRPKSLNEYVGQEKLKEMLKVYIETAKMRNESLDHVLLYGPPGLGKTTLAYVIANEMKTNVKVTTGPALARPGDLAAILSSLNPGDVLFVDEIHRFNRSQQDSFLPYVEDGTVVLVGATTENPSFELNAALLSRCKVFVLNRLDDDSLEKIIAKAEKITGKNLPVTDEARALLKSMADGDGRALGNMLEVLFDLPERDLQDGALNAERLAKVVSRRAASYDKDRDGHYNLISAVHKSLRGSDPDAALYWVARMMAAGEDPKYIFRRLTRFAVEDVGLADPNALVQATNAWNAYERLGSPEGDLALAQLVVYLATAPKSIGVYRAWNAAFKKARETGSLMPPKCILNAPTKLMKQEGYSDGYIYDPDTKDGFSGLNYFPQETGRMKFYEPVERGFEREILKRLIYWDKLRKEKQNERR